MEALGLVGGIIAVVQAGDRVIELLKKIRPLFDAPKHVDLLIEEISAFKAILTDLQMILDQAVTLPGPIHIGNFKINNNFEQARNVLVELELLVQNSLLKSQTGSNGSRKISRVGWTKKIHEVEHLRQRLRDAKMNILVQLGGVHANGFIHLSQSVDTIAHSVAAQLSQHSKIQESIMQNFESLSLQLTTLIDSNYPIDDEIITEMDPPAANENDAANAELSLNDLPGFSAQLLTLRTLKLRVEQHYHCGNACPCRCHQECRLSTPRTIDSLFGSLRISWLPLFAYRNECDRNVCQAKSKSMFSFQYKFPRWLLGRILILSYHFSQQMRPEFVLRVLQVRPLGSPIFTEINRDNVHGVHQLLNTGQASLLDITDVWSTSLLFQSLGDPVRINVAKYLILSGADIFREEVNGIKCFEVIWMDILSQNDTDFDHYRLLRPLIPHIDRLDTTDFTTIHRIVLGLHGGNLEEELRKGVESVDPRDFSGRTPLCWAAKRGDVRSVLLLLEAGADPNIVNHDGSSPLAEALSRGRAICAFVLLRHGADATLKDKYGNTSLHMLTTSHLNHEISVKSIKFGDGIRRPRVEVFLPIRNLENFIVTEMLEGVADIDAEDDSGTPALHFCIQENNPGLLACLLEKGANYQKTNVVGSTILHKAALYANVAVLKVLKSHKLKGLRIDTKHKNGLTALDMAEERTGVTDEWLEAWKALIESILESEQEPDDASVVNDNGNGKTHDNDQVDSYEDGHEAFEDARENFE